MRALTGVTAVDANPVTGSVLVEYNSDSITADALFDVLDVELPVETERQGAILNVESSSQGKEVRDAVAEKLIEFAAERLLLAVLA